MSFDWKTFAGSFLNEITAGIEEREEEAEKFKEKREAAAVRNAALVRESRSCCLWKEGYKLRGYTYAGEDSFSLWYDRCEGTGR